MNTTCQHLNKFYNFKWLVLGFFMLEKKLIDWANKNIFKETTSEKTQIT